MSFEEMLQLLSNEMTLMIIGGLLLFFIVLLVIRRIRVRSLLKRLNECEVRYNSIKSVPLQFKLNKAIALARISEDVSTTVNHSQQSYLKIQDRFKEIATILADTEDLILTGKLKDSKDNCSDLHVLLDETTDWVEDTERTLNLVLEQEAKQRVEITKLKDEFREIKASSAAKANALSISKETLDSMIGEVEKMFSSFEEWMFASEFEKASEKTLEIDEQVKRLSTLVQQLPDLIAQVKGILPRLVDDVSYNYSRYKQKGVYLTHLDVAKNLEFISSTLKEDLTSLRTCSIEKVKEHCEDNEKRLKQLLTSMQREEKAYDDLVETRSSLSSLLAENTQLFSQLKKQGAHIALRYGYMSYEDKIPALESALLKSNETYRRLEKMMVDHSVPASTLIVSFKESLQDVGNQNKDIQSQLQILQSAQSDEDRAKKQPLKLHLIMNEISSKIAKHRLPTISDSYQGDVVAGEKLIMQIEEMLDKSPLDVKKLNPLVANAIDTIYKLYNNVNNIVGMVDMIEHAIVFGNKYRSSLPMIDSELTRAELSFRNGEYTQALTIALSAVEKIHPNSYEELIKENARSGRN